MITYETIEKVLIPHADLPYEQRHISEFKGFDWKKATKWDAVSFARASGFKETGMSVNEVALMYDLLEAKKPKTIVELGRNYGCSTRLFLAYIWKYGGILSSWDLKHWDGFLETMAENGYLSEELTHSPGDYCLDGAHIKIGHSIKSPVTKELDGKVDFILIDTEHSIANALYEYGRWREYLASGSVVAFHDSTLPGVARAIELAIEVEEAEKPGRIIKTYENERVDGYGIFCMEWKG